MSIAVPSLVEAFAQELERAHPRRKALTQQEYTETFLRSAPHLATSPDRQQHLADALAELEGRGIVARAKSRDGRGPDALPRRIILCERTDDPPISASVARYPWRPELAFAAALPLRRSEFNALIAIQAFLRDTPDATPVPTGERSLKLFGDEKRLDAFLRNRRLVGPGRITLELLKIYRCSPPFAYTSVGEGEVALVIENAATYSSVIASLPMGSPVGIVAFGGGNSFVRTVAYFGDLAAKGQTIRAIRYFGDLDQDGLRIPDGADSVARELGLPRVLPAPALWAALLHHGMPAKHPAVSPAVAARLVRWLPAGLRVDAERHLIAGTRLAQEALSLDVLRLDTQGAFPAGLNLPAAASTEFTSTD
ncbi:MAG: hypothetical protein ACRDF0_09095 [Candidatus Limnocylindria bacterium]